MRFVKEKYKTHYQILLLTQLLIPYNGNTQDAATIEPDIFYVPTPEDVVTAMLNIARVKADDIVFDLGSGDGRIVIAAAREFGAKGVGVEIDPKYIQQSQQKAKDFGVSDKVTFIQGDLFEIEFRDATVITLYLSPELNLKLKPRFLNELKPGTRIVSHEFLMGDWEPDDSIVVVGHKVFHWNGP